MIVREIKIDVFEASIFFFWNCKPKEAEKYLKNNISGFPKHFNDWLINNNDNQPKGVCLSNFGKSPSTVIWLHKSPKDDIGTCVHEVSHAVHRIMAHWSIDLTEDTQEILAMLHGYIINKIMSSKH